MGMPKKRGWRWNASILAHPERNQVFLAMRIGQQGSDVWGEKLVSEFDSISTGFATHCA
jgi:hypothetical protein